MGPSTRCRAPIVTACMYASRASVTSPLLVRVEQRLGLEQVDAAVDQVDEMADLRLLLDLLGDEPLKELEASVVPGAPSDLGRFIELPGHGTLGLERALDRVER